MQIFQVGEIAAYLRELLEGDPVLRDVWITGEVSSVTRSARGHYYFSLKDDDSQLRAVMFRGAAERSGADPKPGDSVVAHGRLDFYPPNGSCQFNVDLLYPAGVGAAQLRFEALRLKLETEGLFAADRKRPLPPLPRRIGLVTSEQGAVVHDVITVLSRRYPLAELILSHSSVQGEQAPTELVTALERLTTWRSAAGLPVDVVIIARGGGAPEELAAFDDERVARAVFAAPWPTISAVGHETDYTICDLVADVRAPTPSAAAELVAPHIATLAAAVRDLAASAERSANLQVGKAQAERTALVGRLRAATPLPRIQEHRRLGALAVQRAQQLVLDQTRFAGHELSERSLQLGALSPLATLARGYGIVTRFTQPSTPGQPVTSVSQVEVGDDLDIQVIDGAIAAVSTTVRSVSR